MGLQRNVMNPRITCLGVCIAAAVLSSAPILGRDTLLPPEDIAFFESRIRPVLIRHCYECHSSAAAEIRGGLLLDSRDGVRKGGDTGAAVVPGQPADSLLLEALRFESFEMPPSGRLPNRVVSDFKEWIRRGTPDPRVTPPTAAEVAEAAWEIQFEERRHWWSLQPLKQVRLPAARWSLEPVDRFVATKLDHANLTLSPPASAEVLLRRLSFVLTGLPPKPEDVLQFPERHAAEPEMALAQMVETLLESPHFGERFARHWMDVVRYTDTYGYEWDNPAKGAWEYRDYLIRAFNDDIGFDQLIREQLAGDLLPGPRINERAGVNESLIGPMFYHMGEHRHGSSLGFNGLHQDMIDNKIDAFSKAFLATTVACARCHNHKLDAVSQKDYYALAGVFMSPRWTSRVVDAPGRHDEAIAALGNLRGEIHRQLSALWAPADDEFPIRPSVLKKWAAEQSAALKAATPDDVGYPVARIAASGDATIVSDWSELRSQWASTRSARMTSRGSGYTVISDFSQPGFPDGWVTEGDGMEHGYVADGTPLVSLTGSRLVDELLPRGYHTHALSSRLPGAVRLPPQHDIDCRYISLNVRGGEWAGRLIVPQNAFQSEFVFFLNSGIDGEWLTTEDVTRRHGVSRVTTEFMTASLNPNFPPRTGLAHAGDLKLEDSDDGFDKRSWLSITGIVVHDAVSPPPDLSDHFQTLYEPCEQVVTTTDEAWTRVANWLNGAIRRWTENSPAAGDVRLINWLITQNLLPNRPQDAPAIAELVRKYREIEDTIEFPRTVNSMDEREIDPVDYRLNIRGDVYADGPEVPRGFLSVFNGKNQVQDSRRSGRLELAEYLSSRQNPQTARVYVNRVWQWIFGQGIVSTPDDFGRLGDMPSHPDLLDWLATDFMDSGWSTKQLVRRLVLSRTFRQSGLHSQVAGDQDPDNRLLHHYPTRRLEAEAIRDSMLMVSGRLAPTLYGRPINPPRSVEDGAKRLYSGVLDSHGRRSLYMTMSIMDPPRFLVAFNLSDLKIPTGRRDVTNVPAQALALLNAPLVIQLANAWGARISRDHLTTPEARVRAMFISAMGRIPDASEIRRWTEALLAFRQTGNLMKDEQAWSELAHAFFNTKEFIYFR